MAAKTVKSKKPAKMAGRNIGVVAPIKDDGDKYRVVRDLKPVYLGSGIDLAEAVRLSTSMIVPAGIAKVEGDNLIPGELSADGKFVAVEAQEEEASA